MTNFDGNPPLNNHMDDENPPSLESSQETDTLEMTRMIAVSDPAVSRLDNSIVQVPALDQDIPTVQQAEAEVKAEGTMGTDVEAGTSGEDDRNALSEVQWAQDSGNPEFPEEAIPASQNVRWLSARE